MARAVWMVRENWRGLSDEVVRTLSMWSISGITIVRFGVPCEKKSVVLLKIWQRSKHVWSSREWNKYTSKTSCSSLAIPQSDGTNSYLWRLKSQVAVMVSIAGWYLVVKLSMLKVEFHWVVTSHGIMWWGRLCAVSVLYHCGRRIVVKFLRMKAIFHNFLGVTNQSA